MEKTLKNLLLAGIGTIAYGYEKGAAVIEELVKKGEISIEQGKELNAELKKKLSKTAAAGSEAYSELLAGLNLVSKKEFAEFKAGVEKELTELKEMIKNLENK
ncbi:hypothetical protein Tfer_0981 [Thermincola ferriacetica]|uniref:Polyhydroxyalkanoate synthesis regulator phasin n=1 Tax=Thermincola ferriacetica TaxID=281456 RepID=A0A0L6W4H7_9FIRM|nr:hypothetical protein [Thermincola ferriacetica]KNZ70415.1 hypothetical protein Tfer_0981 [Thermincola ferriacetica]